MYTHASPSEIFDQYYQRENTRTAATLSSVHFIVGNVTHTIKKISNNLTF